MDPKIIENSANKIKKPTQEELGKKLKGEVLEILGNNRIYLTEGKKELLNKVITLVIDRVANNCLSPQGKKKLPELLKAFLEHRIGVFKGKIEGTEPDEKLDKLIDDLYLEVELDFIQGLGHSIADILIIKQE